MKNFIITLIILILIGVALWLWPVEDIAAPESRFASPTPTRPNESAAMDNAPITGRIITYHPLADVIGDTKTSPERDPELLLELFLAYHRLTGVFPSAQDNAGVMRQLRGQNAGNIRLFPEAHPRFTRDGTLLDGWGTPFFFDGDALQHLEIRSAGPDRTFFTVDDIFVAQRPDVPE